MEDNIIDKKSVSVGGSKVSVDSSKLASQIGGTTGNSNDLKDLKPSGSTISEALGGITPSLSAVKPLLSSGVKAPSPPGTNKFQPSDGSIVQPPPTRRIPHLHKLEK